MFFVIESMVAFSDVLCLSREEARCVKCWAVRALVQCALENPTRRKRRTKSAR